MNADAGDNSFANLGAACVFIGLGLGPRLARVPDGSGGYFILVVGSESGALGWNSGDFER